jgi:hypothetical protein
MAKLLELSLNAMLARASLAKLGKSTHKVRLHKARRAESQLTRLTNRSYFEPIPLVLSALRNPVVVESKLEWHWDSKSNIIFASLSPNSKLGQEDQV